MGRILGVKVPCGRRPGEPLVEGNCAEREQAWEGSRKAKPGLDGQELRKEARAAG